LGGLAHGDAARRWTVSTAYRFLLVTNSPRVLVTDGEERAALAACRGLRDAGYSVTVACRGRSAAAAWSRAREDQILLPDPRSWPQLFVQELLEHAKGGEWDVLLPGSEASLLPISERRDELEPYLALGLPPHNEVLDSLDKDLLRRRAIASGLAPPTSVVCTDPHALAEAAAQLGYPLVVMPMRSFRAEADVLRQSTALVVTGTDGLGAVFSQIWTPLIAQQHVGEARVVSCAGVRTTAGLAGFTVARYSRTWPPSVGSASFATTISPPDGLRNRVYQLISSIGWTGIFELELLELHGNRLGAIDLNPRVFGWLALALGAGANLPAIWCDDLLQRRQTSTADATPGCNYRWEEGEAKYVLRHLLRGDARGLAPIRPRRRVVHAYFQLRDPAPLAVQALVVTRHVLVKQLMRLRPASLATQDS
jgi:predicted ATP-grasp superfamily ATP-dependent carboligase